MKIIKEGTKNLAECNDCGAILKYEPGDVLRKYHPEHFYDMEEYDNYSVRCPCGCEIDISSKISSGLAQRVKEIEKINEDINI